MTKEGEPPMRGQPEMTRPGSLITDRELEEKIAELEKENSEAASWGAAVGAREEWIKELRGELGRRVRKEFPQLVVAPSTLENLPDAEIMDIIADLAGGNVRALRSIQGWLIKELEGELRRRNPHGKGGSTWEL